jgi:hypothetical protein
MSRGKEEEYRAHSLTTKGQISGLLGSIYDQPWGAFPCTGLYTPFFSLHCPKIRQDIPRDLDLNARSDVPAQLGIKSEGSDEELPTQKRESSDW